MLQCRKKKTFLKYLFHHLLFLPGVYIFLENYYPSLKKSFFPQMLDFLKIFFIQKSFGEKILNISWGKNHLKKNETNLSATLLTTIK